MSSFSDEEDGMRVLRMGHLVVRVPKGWNGPGTCRQNPIGIAPIMQADGPFSCALSNVCPVKMGPWAVRDK